MLLLCILIVAGAYCLRAGYRDAKATANRVREGHKQRVRNWADGIEPAPSNAGQRAGIAVAAFGTAAWLGLRSFFAGVRDAWPDGMNAGAEFARQKGWTRTAERAQRPGRHRAPEPTDEPGPDEQTSTVHDDDHTYCTPPGCGTGCPQYRTWAWACNRCGAGGGGFTTEQAAGSAQRGHACSKPVAEDPEVTEQPPWGWSCAACDITEGPYPNQTEAAAGYAHHKRNCPHRQPKNTNTKENPVATEMTVETLIAEMTSEQAEATAAVDQATEVSQHASDRIAAATLRVDRASSSGFTYDVTSPLTTVADALQAYKDACHEATLAAHAASEAASQCLTALEKHRAVAEAASGLTGGQGSMANRDAYTGV